MSGLIADSRTLIDKARAEAQVDIQLCSKHLSHSKFIPEDKV